MEMPINSFINNNNIHNNNINDLIPRKLGTANILRRGAFCLRSFESIRECK